MDNTLYKIMADKNARAPLVILHFNDVYEIEPREQEPKGPGGGHVSFSSLKKRINIQVAPLVSFHLCAGWRRRSLSCCSQAMSLRRPS